MDYVNIILTSLSMAADASAVNTTNGIKEPDMSLKKMVLISLTFGIFQFVMPLISYSIGSSFKGELTQYLGYISFALLLFLSIKSFIEWLKEFKVCEEIQPKKITTGEILIQGVATSIDALCIGLVYINLTYPQALIAFSIIGGFAFILPLIAILLSKYVARYISKWSGLIASLIFLGIGLKILLESILK